MYVVGYGCYTAAGKGAHALYQGLLAGRDYCTPLDCTDWPAAPMTGARLCRWRENRSGQSQKDHLVDALVLSFEEARSLHPKTNDVLESGRLGVILASTKGCIDDHVWSPEFGDTIDDTLTPVLDCFVKKLALYPLVTRCVSNACSSVHGALWLARSWLDTDRVDHVIIAAADQAGPFVVNGFSALKTFAETWVTPFAKDRQGIQLGDAAVVLVVSNKIESTACITDIAIESDGFAATRSDAAGVSLHHVVEQMPRPDLIIAHATGTPANDIVEDHVYSNVFEKAVPVTCTKWSVGHGLGASGGVDVVAGLEILKHQGVFSIGNTSEADPDFKGYYLVCGSSPDQGHISNIMISSMGFGGMHGALSLSAAHAQDQSAASSVFANDLVIRREDLRFTVDPFVKEEPAWVTEVPRWHQLDPVTFAVVEAGSRLRRDHLRVWKARPDSLWLPAKGGSNIADHGFVRTGSRSPSRFVGTLPSIRSSSLTLLMNWRGPVLCMVGGDSTKHACIEASSFISKNPGIAWVVSCERVSGGAPNSLLFDVTFTILRGDKHL